MKMSEALTLVRPHLAKTLDEYDNNYDLSIYICVAAEHAADKLPLDHPAQELLNEDIPSMIHDRLGNHSTVWQWLHERGHLPDTEILNKNYTFYRDQIQKYRHRWLSALIREFKAKGN